MGKLTSILCVFVTLLAQAQEDSTKQKSLDEVTVSATRASFKTAMAFSNVGQGTIKKQNLGQDLPFLLNLLPSVVVSSDAGAGVGYTGIRVRGTDPTRINVTINGIPQNDSESQGLYWVNTPDLASSTSSIQLQRGVGTSTNGGSAFGATLNLNTLGLERDAYIEANTSYGSFNTSKLNLKLGSGLLKNGLNFDARFSKISSDGFIDRANSALSSAYFSGGYYRKENFIKLISINGQERTYQAWEGVPEELIKTNRTYNPYKYLNQVDNYAQGNHQLLGSVKLNKYWRLNPSLHYTKGKGFYEQFKENEKLSLYSLGNTRADIVRRKWLDNDFYGAVFSVDYEKNKTMAYIGGGLNQYKGVHFGEVIKQAEAELKTPKRWYESNATKTDKNLYAKLIQQHNTHVNTFWDLQIRQVSYAFVGTGDKKQMLDTKESYTFFNPKFGLNANLNHVISIYGSFAIGNKEPSRQDFVDNAPAVPKAEQLLDTEIGIRIKRPQVLANVNVYNMAYRNQLVLTGALNQVGEAIRINVPNSYRRGIEMELSGVLNPYFSMAANLTLSSNKIKDYTDIAYDYDRDGEEIKTTYAETNISFSPNVIAGAQMSFNPNARWELSLMPKYVGKQYLDNTGSDNKKLDAFFTNDLRIVYAPKLKRTKNLSFTLLINNVLNHQYESNGYTYSYIADKSLSVNNFYYPQAGINVLGGMSIRF